MPMVSGSGVPPNPRYQGRGSAGTQQRSEERGANAGASDQPRSRLGLLFGGVSLVILALLAAWAHSTYSISPKTGLFSQFPDLQVKDLSFFESDSTIPPLGQRTYQSRFSKHMARYINWELNLQYSPRQYDVKFPLSIVYYRSDGGIYARFNGNFQIDKNWGSSRHCLGWGSNNPGQWPAGDYKVEIASEEKLLARGSFTIEPEMEVKHPLEQPNSEKPLASIHPVSIFLGFFEHKILPGGPPQFTSRFPQANTRHINYELRISSPAKEQVTAPFLDVVFYGPGGRVFARQRDAYRISPNAVIAWHEGGRGYDQPGQWPAGNYVVEFRSAGTLVARGNFAIN